LRIAFSAKKGKGRLFQPPPRLNLSLRSNPLRCIVQSRSWSASLAAGSARESALANFVILLKSLMSWRIAWLGGRNVALLLSIAELRGYMRSGV
jgi:hypothetical protein